MEKRSSNREESHVNHVTACTSRQNRGNDGKALQHWKALEEGWVTFGQFSADFLRQSFSTNRNKTG